MNTGWSIALLLLAALVLALVVLALTWSRPGRASRGRNRRALAGEVEAEALLEERGFAILERQAPGSWWIWVDGEPEAVGVRADYLVARGGLSYVAEVKTGQRAPDPLFAATRRQLLEYSLAFDVDGILLVDAEQRTIRTVAFPVSREEGVTDPHHDFSRLEGFG